MTSSKQVNVNPPPTLCTGCGLCADLCHVNAIEMTWNNDGFLVPTIDPNLCIGCTACIRHCIANKDREQSYQSQPLQSYGGWNKNEEDLLQSSSGGIFSAIARWIFEKKGCVFGVVWADSITAKFAKAESLVELAPMRGSKYTQAKTQGVYRSVKEELKTGRPVLFSGVPCQVHALKTYLGKIPKNLITVDIVCHGVPSHILLEKYVSSYKTHCSEISELKFRDKRTGWLNYQVKHIYNNGDEKLYNLSKDKYMRLFLSDRILNKPCYQCAFLSHPRPGDLTLGDFWGVDYYHKDWPLKGGIAAILVNTEKGKMILNHIGSNITIHEESYERMLSHQNGFKRDLQIPHDRDKILAMLKEKELDKVVEYACDCFSFAGFRINRRWFWYQWLKRIKGSIKKVLQHDR